jgi:hypothetical protein
MATDLTQVQKKLWDLDTPLVHVLNQHTAPGTNDVVRHLVGTSFWGLRHLVGTTFAPAERDHLVGGLPGSVS